MVRPGQLVGADVDSFVIEISTDYPVSILFGPSIYFCRDLVNLRKL